LAAWGTIWRGKMGKMERRGRAIYRHRGELEMAEVMRD
jgi:hypothetical protein